MASDEEDWVHPCDRLGEGEDPTEFLSETALKALTYFEALHGSKISLSNSNDYRGAVVSLWQAIANRKASRDDVLVWAEAVAKAVCENVLDPRDIKNTSEKARDAAMKSIGLSGRKDDNWEARETLGRFLDHFAFIREVSPDPNTLPAEPSRSDCLEFMRAQGFYRDLDDKAAGSRIDRLRYE